MVEYWSGRSDCGLLQILLRCCGGEGLEAFKKLHLMVPDSIEVIYQLASVYLELKDNDNALEWFKFLVTQAPTDPP